MTDAKAARSGLVQSAIGFGSRAVIQLCLLAVTIVAIRSLEVAEFGAFAIAAALMFLFRRLFYVGPYEYMLKTPGDGTLNGSSLIANIVFATGSIILICLISVLSGALFGTDLVGSLLRWLAPSLVLTTFTSWFEALLLRRQKMTQYFGFTVLGEIVGAAAAIGALAAGFGVFSLVVQVYARLATLLLCYVGAALRIAEPIWRGYDLKESRTIVGWSKSRYATVFVNFFSVYGSDLMLGALLSPAATGIFRAGNRIVTALTDLFAQPLQKIAQTNLSARLASGAAADQSWLGMFSAVAAVGWAALAALAVLAHDVVPAVLGEQWRSAAPIVIVMCAIRALPILDATTVSMLVCGNRQRFIFNVQMATATLVLGAGASLAAQGPLAVAVGLGAILLGQSIFLCREVARLSGVSRAQLVRALVTALTPACCAIAAVQLFRLLFLPLAPAWLWIGLLLVAAGVGATIGLVIVRRGVLDSARLLAPYRPAAAQG